MAGQTYSPYRRAGSPQTKLVEAGRAELPRRSGLVQMLAPSAPMVPATPAPVAAGRLAVQAAGPSAATTASQRAGTAIATGLADPAARRWVVLGAIGIITSLLLTVAVALLSSRGVASADVPVAEATRPNRTTLVREIGGAPRSPTPGAGTTASAPAAAGSAGPEGAGQSLASTALRQLRRVGRAIVGVDGVRRLALGGAVPFMENSPATASLLPDGSEQVALADSVTANDDDADVRLGAGATFMRLAERDADDGLRVSAQAGRSDVTVLASPVAVTSTPTARPANTTNSTTPVATATSVPATAVPPTAVPATATSIPPTAIPPTATSAPATATSVPPTTVPATATSVPPTATSAPVFVTATPMVVVVVTATPLPATQTPIVVTATPEPTQRATQTPVVVTATPSSIFATSTVPYVPQPTIPWLPSAPTAAPTSAPFVIGPPPTAAPTYTPIPTATLYVVPDPRSAPVAAAPAAPATTNAPRRTEPAAPAGPAPILSETGTRTPFNPAPRAAARPAQAPEGQPGQPAPSGQGQSAAPAQPTEPSREAAILDKLAGRALLAVNAARAQAGALPLTRNPAMDTASALHAQYDVATGQADGNFQTRGTPLFVGETPSARVARAGGGRSPAGDRVAEVMALGEVEPERAVQGWLDSVFHRAVILDLAAQFVGFGQQTAGAATSSVMDLGGKREVANASGWFPASGATEVPTRCTCDDYAEATGKTGPFGYPATLLLGQVRPQGMPALARMSEVDENGAGVAADLVDAYGNPTLLPQQPLKPGTRYVVRMAWTNGPTVSWAFTTAAQ